MPIDLAALLAPAHTALVTQECQRGVIGDRSVLPEIARAAAPIVPRVATLAEAARRVGVRVVHCTALRRADGLGSSSNARLFAATRKRRVAIKNLLLDQSILAGVGNIYADEALFLARVRPTRSAARVTRRECDAIATGLHRVLERSIETGGSSISDYVAPDGRDGEYQSERRVYARRGEPCTACGARIARVVLGARSTHYCPRCQR